MTIRTEAQLQTQFSDNTSGDIGADDMRDFLDTHFQSRQERIEAIAFARATGPNRPKEGVIGATSYLEFEVDDEATFHLTLPPELDIASAVDIHIDMAPIVSEVGVTVTWEFSYLVMGSLSKTIDTIDGVLTIVDAAVDPTQWQDQNFTFTIPAIALFADAHEINFKLKRALSGNDGANVAVHHVYAEVITKPPGAS